MIDWGTIAAVIGSAVATLTLTLIVMKTVGSGSWKLATKLASVETNVVAMQGNLVAVQSEITRVGDVLVKIADMRGDIRVLGERVTNAEQDIRDLQRGEGYVLPISKSSFETR